MRRIGRRIILWSNFNHIAADDVEPMQTAQYLLGLARSYAPHFRGASAWSIGRVDSVHGALALLGDDEHTERWRRTLEGMLARPAGLHPYLCHATPL